MIASRTPSGSACVLLSCASLSLLGIRLAATGDGALGLLVLNLGLAWLPYLAALAVEKAHRRELPGYVLAGLGLVWLLFLPNAPYLVTDFVHVDTSSAGLAVLDTITIGAFATTGLLLGFASLCRIQAVASARLGAAAAWSLVLGSLILSGVGIYLGRVHQLNSWDVVVRPGRLLGQTLPALADPLAHARAFGGTLAGGLLLALAYAVVYRAAIRSSGSDRG